MRPRKPRITQECRSAWKNLLIRRLHVRVRANHRAHLPVQHSRQRRLLGSRLRMHIHKDNVRLPSQLLNLRSRASERIIQIRHERPPLQIQDRHRRLVARLIYHAPLPRRPLRIIQRPQKPRFILQESNHLLLVPKMVPGCDDIHPCRKNLLRRLGCDARSSCRVLPIRNHQVQLMLPPQSGQDSLYRFPPRFAHNVANKKNLHCH
ncbi:MAG: hypothetical protein JWR26_1979 [Pedosphaera sp.]|nr:hypothetical protein [Pedosphaera sp.]